MNIPNILTTFRFFMVPAFVYVFFSSSERSLIYAIGIFLLAGITDVLDGYLARKLDQITDFGTTMDPLADKLMLLTALGCLTVGGYIPLWIILIVFVKETLMVVGGLVLYFRHEKVVIPASWHGKIATAFFYLAIVIIPFGLGRVFSLTFLSIAVILKLVAFVHYLRGYLNRTRTS